MSYVILGLLLAGLLVFIFHPALKGWRTVVLGWFSTVGLGIVPFLTQVTDYLKGLDWRQYVLSWGDKQNLLVLLIPGVLGLLIVILRYKTTGPVGTKQ